jgi:ABC-type antimicrobial peptide transport system permease subunit
MYYLHNTDLGFAFKNRASIVFGEVGINVLNNQIKQIPEVTETLIASTPLLPLQIRKTSEISNWDGKSQDMKEINISMVEMPLEYATYYEFQLIEGEMLNESDDKKLVLINESAAKMFGWHTSVRKSFDNYTVKGVIKDVYNFAPTIPVKPYCYVRSDDNENGVILFKYKTKTWKTCKDKIEQLFKKEYPQIPNFMISKIIFNEEEEYNKYLKSENALLKILTFVSLICVIICIFGFVSLVSLTCEERRKEIAIRKINGATMKDILDIFFKENFLLLIIGAIIAFPIGYIIMKAWLEQYIVKTSISAWIYAVILLALMLSIILCVGWKVYKTSRENPSEILKT